MFDIERIAGEADVIINGYAVSACEEGIRVDNLNTGSGSAVFKLEGTLIETNMDGIELELARTYAQSAQKYMVA